MTRTYTFDYSTQYLPSGPIIDIYVYNKANPENVQRLSLLIDSGADATILPIHLLEKIDAPVISMATLRSIDGSRFTTFIYRVSLRIGDHTINRVNVASAEESDRIVLGRDVLNYLVVTLDGPAGATILI
ncbi:MAG: retropepsin-like aspartic protease [Chloroflexota bacterium]